MDRIDFRKVAKMRELQNTKNSFININFDLLGKVLQAKYELGLPLVKREHLINPHKKAN